MGGGTSERGKRDVDGALAGELEFVAAGLDARGGGRGEVDLEPDADGREPLTGTGIGPFEGRGRLLVCDVLPF